MKKLICLLLAFVLLLSGCGNSTNTPEESTEPSKPPFEATYPTMSETEPATDEEILAYRRDVVEQQMRYMCTVRWSPSMDMMYSLNGKSKGADIDLVENPGDVVMLYADRIYEGIPYTHAACSGYDFISFATGETDTGVLEMEGFTTAYYNGSGSIPERHGRLGNDCADMLFWAWAHVSTTINFTLTKNMNENTGCVKVGDYDYSDELNLNTKGACQINGIERMCEAYALLQKGDGLVFCNDAGGGHSIMSVTTNVVRDENGQIDPNASYITVLEQTSGNERAQSTADVISYVDETTGETIYPLENVDTEFTFYYLFSKGYLPFTCKELIDPSPLPEVTITDSIENPSLANMFSGIVDSPYRISNVTITITDSEGKEVQSSTMFALANELHNIDLSRFTHEVEQDVLQGLIDVDSLEPGEYTATYTARISTGETLPFRTFTFTK